MSQPQNPTAKRRRLDNAAVALSRPFKSPLPKSAQRKEATDPNTPNATTTQSESAKEQQTPTHSYKPATSKSPHGSSLNFKTTSPETDPEILSLRRKRLTLQAQLASLRAELDTAKQALRIESSSRDDELRALKLKWRGISQRAAEELFQTAKDKIERMGGVVAWKESERQRVKRMSIWEDDEFYAAGGGEGGEGGDREKGDGGFDDYEEGGEKEDDEDEVSVFLLMRLLVLWSC